MPKDKHRILGEFIAATGYHQVTKRYHPPQTPCERLLTAEGLPIAAKEKLREISSDLDPLQLLKEMRAVQAYLAALADVRHRHR